MSKVIIDYSLDMSAEKKQDPVIVKQSDTNSRQIRITMKNKGALWTIPFDCQIFIYVRKKDGKVVFRTCERIDEHKVLAPISEQAIAIPGTQEAEIYFLFPGGDIKSQTFPIQVEPKVMDEDAIESKDEFKALQTVLNDADEITAMARDAGQAASEAKTLAEEAAKKAMEAADSIQLSVDAAAEAKISAETAKTSETEVLRMQEEITEYVEAEKAVFDGKNYLSLAKLQEMYPDMVKNVEKTDTGIKVSFWDDAAQEIEITAEGGLSFDSGYMSEDGFMHLTMDGVDIEGFTPFFVGSGGGGGGATGSKLTFAVTSPTSFSVAETSGIANVVFRFASVDVDSAMETGNGTLEIYVGGTLKRSMSISQGENTVNIFEFLKAGSNSVRLVLTDSYGTSATRNCTISVESLTMTWNLGKTEKNTGILTIYLTPVGTGAKKVIIKVDGEVYSETEVASSGRRITRTVTDLSHGSHIVEAYCTMEISGTAISSERLVSGIAQVEEDGTAPVITSSFEIEKVMQHATLEIPYRVIDPGSNPSQATLSVNGENYDTLEIDQTEQVWSYRAAAIGTLKLAITCGASSWSKTITVEALSTPAEEVTENLVVKFDAAAIANLDAWDYNGIDITLSDKFDRINGGLKTDADGNRGFLIMKGDRATLNYKPFADDARRTGKELKIIYQVDHCSKFDTTAISCMDSNIGLEIQANACVCCSEQSTLEMQTCEGMRTELDLVIMPSSGDRLMTYWEAGSQAKAIQYAENDNFTQVTPANITIGSDDCNVWVYLIRCYSSDLSDVEVRANYIADGTDGNEITKRYNESQIYDSAGNIDKERVTQICPKVHVMTWHGDSISTSKSNKVTGYLTHKYPAGGAGHSWTAYGAVDKVQGTSSAAYVLAGLNHDFEAVKGFTLEDGTVIEKYAMTENSIPVKYFNFKLNVASSENINNILLAEWYNRYQPYIRAAREVDPKIRDTVEGHMAVLFYHNTGTVPVQAGAATVMPDETIFYGIGNLNNSKKNLDVFGQTDACDDDIAVIELLNNTSDQNRFKSDDLSKETWDGDGNYEFRYLSDSVSQEEIVSCWQAALSFVVSCNPDKATKKALSELVVYDGVTYSTDTKEYRIAKYKAEVGNYFVMDSILYHQLFTLVFCMPDNRAKNTFWAYSKKQKKWHLNFSYDHDTGMGNDNEGGLTLRYGYMDTDTIGSKSVFNAADSTIFQLNWAAFPDRLKSLFIDLENKGCWDMEAFATLCTEYQEMICPALWAEDAVKKYISPLVNKGSSAYLPMLNGKKRLQRAQFLKFQRPFMSSYFVGTYCVANTGTIRGYTPTSWSGVRPASTMTITPYCDLFIVVKAGSITTQKRAYAGKSVSLNLGVASMNDTEVYIYSAPFIQDLGELACLYPGYCDLAAFERLKYAKIGSSTSGYKNTNLTEVSVANCLSLEELNVEKCPELKQALSLDNNLMLKRLLTRGSGVTGVTFAPGGRITEARLNGILSLTAKYLQYLETITMDSYANVISLVVEQSPAVDSLYIVQQAQNLARIRLLEVAWSIDRGDLLLKLAEIGGIDDDGYNSDKAVLTGACHIEQVSESVREEIKTAFPNLTVTYGFDLKDYTVKFISDDGTVWSEQIVEHGKSAVTPDVIPTKESTVDTVFTFSGWAGSYTNVTENLKIWAIFTPAVRVYTVRFFNELILLQTIEVECYGTGYYTGPDLSKPGYVWEGWDTSTTSVTSDLEVYAVFTEPSLPAEPADMSQFDYLYSYDPADRSAYTLGEIYAICEGKLGKTYMSVGDEIKLEVKKNDVFTEPYIIFQVYGFNHFRLAEGEGFANIVFGMRGLLSEGCAMMPIDVYCWPHTKGYEWLNNTVKPVLPYSWQTIMKTVKVLSSYAPSDPYDGEIVTSHDKLFIFSKYEVGSPDKKYLCEIDEEAEDKTFTIFTDDKSRIKGRPGRSRDDWWLRTRSKKFISYVFNSGSVAVHEPNYVMYICFGFCI